MSTEFLVSRAVEIPESPTSDQWVDSSEAISNLRLEIERLRRAQPVEIPVKDHDSPIDVPSETT